MNQKRRKLLLRTGSTALTAWSVPIISSIAIPAHAQTSVVPPVPPVPPQDLCSMVVTGNSVFGPISGTSVPAVCSLTFDILSSVAGSPLTIISVTNNVLPADNVVIYDVFGEATDTAGPRIVWRGPASDAPFCSDLMPISQDEITFTVTATCSAADGREFTQSFTLADVLV